MRVYTAKQAAKLLGSHVSSIRQIPEEELPKHRQAGKGIETADIVLVNSDPRDAVAIIPA